MITNAPRPVYESASDLARERSFAEKISQVFKCELHKLPVSYKVDFAATRDLQIVSWIEVKCRNYESTRYRRFMVSVLKWQALNDLAEVNGVPFLICARFTDADYYVASSNLSKPVFEVGGRNTPRDTGDTEPIVWIPLTEFRQF